MANKSAKPPEEADALLGREKTSKKSAKKTAKKAVKKKKKS